MENSQILLDRGSTKCDESEYLLSESRDSGIYIGGDKEATKLRKLCVFVSCTVQLFVSNGLGYGLSVMYAELVIVFNADRTYASLIQSLNLGINLACGILLTAVIKKIGPGAAIMVGAVLACIGFFASAFAKDITTIIIFAGAITGFAMGLCQFSAFLAVGWLFHEDPSRFLIMMTIGIGFGQVTFALLYDIFISSYAWSGAFIILSGFTLQCIPFGLVIHLSNEYYVTEAQQGKKAKPLRCCHVSLFTDIVIWILWINVLLLGQTGNIEPWFMVDHMISRGFTRSEGAFTVSVMGVGNLVGKLIAAAIKFGCTKIPTLYHWVYLGVILAALHAVIVFLDVFWTLLIASALFGFVVGLAWSQVAAMMFEASDLNRYPQAFAVACLAIGIGNNIGALSGGYIKDTYGSYDLDFFVGVGASLYIAISTGLAAFIYRKREKG